MIPEACQGDGIQGKPMAREFCQALFCLDLSMHEVALLAAPLHTPAPLLTAGACALIRIHPFDPPDQEAEASNPQGCKPGLKLDHLRSTMSSISNATPEDWYVITTLALPHLLYAYIWFNSSTWLKTFGKKSVQRFETAAWLLKVLQFSSVIYWYSVKKPEGVILGSISPFAAGISLVLLAAGQALNIGIYRAIGHAGVYYGFKLGHKVPWVEGFPFNVVSHPQYVGSVLSVWAAAILVWAQGPAGLGLLVAYWTGLYVITAIQESCF
uniref:phosphatidyl-N-methylethanolamine N-methyltransferase n=1 Tax=Auxenochlorella protothecoides TaxID=3075 RepID=A0A1D2ABM8_AUXPR